MAPGMWIAPGNEYTVALASGVVYCSRWPMPVTSGESAGVPLAWIPTAGVGVNVGGVAGGRRPDALSEL
jgi:hypothetical protein